jgi:hypothetical protein
MNRCEVDSRGGVRNVLEALFQDWQEFSPAAAENLIGRGRLHERILDLGDRVRDGNKRVFRGETLNVLHREPDALQPLRHLVALLAERDVHLGDAAGHGLVRHANGVADVPEHLQPLDRDAGLIRESDEGIGVREDRLGEAGRCGDREHAGHRVAHAHRGRFEALGGLRRTLHPVLEAGDVGGDLVNDIEVVGHVSVRAA